tara:strand:+ start:435 stop:671 length:237 start_codon:yes stop_codon:yes gene_type:complete
MKSVWWIETDPYIDRMYNRYKHKENRESFKVKHCDSCSNSWEIVRGVGGRVGSTEIKYYPDFPTYGLARNECPSCERK